MRTKRRKDGWPGAIISFIVFIAVLAFTGLILYTNLLPAKYIGFIFLGLMIFLMVIYLLVRRSRRRIRFCIGTGLAVLLLVALGLGGFYIHTTVSSLDTITGVEKDVAEIKVYVLQNDPAQSIIDAAGYSFGILSSLDRGNTDAALSQISEETGNTISPSEYNTLTELADGILNGNSQAVVLNGGYMDVLAQMDGYSDFSSKVREIAVCRVESSVERENREPSSNTENSEVQEEKDSVSSETSDNVYNIYISGIDTRGEMTSSSLSDVNIILTINTETKQALMVSTPRDYYVPLSISNGEKDKLTHAGIYGVNVSMDTLEMLYGIDINYYFRLNFGGFIKIIDALGGITINSDYEFDSQNVAGYHFNKGENHVNGEQALAFCRERYAFSEGDRQRGRNQMAVVQGVVDKATSPELLKNYLSVMNSLEGCFETNISYDTIASLVRDQLDEGGSWQVLSYSVDGTGDNQKPYSMSQTAYVMVPDMTTVDKAKSLMQKVREGIMLSEADVSRQQPADSAS